MLNSVEIQGQSTNGETDPMRPGQARNEAASLAASDSVDTTRRLAGEDDSDFLLPSEDPTTTYRDDVDLWVSVYSELLDFKRFMIDGASSRADQMKNSIARQEIAETDLRTARAEAERFAGRLAYWRRRQDALPTTGKNGTPR